MRDDLTGLGPHDFERLCRALAVCILGPGITAFGSGPDGGREASFSGRQHYPNLADPWDGYGVVQAKYKDQLLGTTADTAWLRGQVKAELDEWADPVKRRVRDGRPPEYLIFATNVPLSSVPGSGGKDRIDELIRQYSGALGVRDWTVWDGNQIEAFLNAYPHVRRSFAALITPSEVLAEQSTMLGVALETRTADEAAGRLARLRERIGALPAAARPALEDALAENPAEAEQLVSAVTDPSALPAETVEAWVQDPPAFLGSPDAPTLHGIWAVIGEIAGAYGLHGHASTAFQRAVAAGSARRAYLLARAGWAALQADDVTRASSLMAPTRSRRSPEAAFEIVKDFVRLTVDSLRSHPSTGTGRLMAGSAAASAGPEPVAADQRLRDSLRRQLAEWDPPRPADRDMRARIGAQIELTDPAGPTPARCNAALQILDDGLARGWLDDTALAAATVLRWRAMTGTAADRSGDLHRSVQLALRARDEYRRARRDSTAAVRTAVAAASEAGRYRQVITIGSAKYGEATPQEAADPQVAKQVILAAAKGVPQVADELAADLGQVPDGFTRAWAQAILTMRGRRSGSAGREERIALWQQALAAGITDDDRREALQGLAAAGADDLPELDELLGEDPATAAEWHARAALARDDPESAVSLMHPHRAANPSAASVLGEAYAALGQTDAAVDTLATAASRFDHDDLIIEAAGISAQAEDPARAERLLTDVLRTAAATWAGRGRARTLLGELQADRGAWPEAIASWDSALEEDPYLDSARWQLIYALASRGEHARAWAVLTAVPAASDDIPMPDNPPTANAAHLALVLLRRNGDLTTLVTYGLQYLKLFRDDERFAGHTLALLTTPSTDEDDPDRAILDPALRADLEQELEAFFTTYPDSQYLRRRSSSELADLVNHLNLDARPSPEMAEQAREFMLAVMRGRQPLGVLLPLSRRPYAYSIVTFAAGVLTAVGESDEHAASVADASAALGIQLLTSPGDRIPHSGPATQREHARGSRLRAAAITPTAAIVTDTTALYVRTLLPHLADVLTSGIREVFLTEHAYTDIITARDEILLPTAGTWVVDPETGQGHLVPLDPAARSLRRSAVDAVFTLAGDCRRLAVQATGSRDLDALTGPEFDPWAGGLRLASGRGSALWADDIALRRLARGAGIPAFSTLALLDAYGQIGLISAEQREEAVRKLIRGYVGDFPPDDGRLRALAARDSNSRGAVCSAMSKPAFWSSPAAAISLYSGLASDLNASSPEIVADLLNASILGITRAGLTPAQAEDLCARLAAATINMVGPLGDVPRLLQALRVALHDADPPMPDILPVIVDHLMSAFQATLAVRGAPDAALAADNVRALFARCLPDDQSTVRRAILLSR